MKNLIPFLVVGLFSSFGFAKAPEKKLSSAEILAAAKPSDWRTVDPDHTLYLELADGRVIIELAPQFVPEHFANIKILANDHYWDDLAIVRVQDNYVAQWGDPNGDDEKKKRSLKTAKATLPAEFDHKIEKSMTFQALLDKDVYAPQTGFTDGFAAARDPKAKVTWLVHCYGALGVGRDNSPESGNGSELYVVIGHGPRHLDRNVTVIGRVLQGMEYLSALPRGHGTMGFYQAGEKNIPIKSIRMASAVAEKDRTPLEVLRTDTDLFRKWVEARRTRSEDWFQDHVGHIEVCNIQVPVRAKTNQ